MVSGARPRRLLKQVRSPSPTAWLQDDEFPTAAVQAKTQHARNQAAGRPPLVPLGVCENVVNTQPGQKLPNQCVAENIGNLQRQQVSPLPSSSPVMVGRRIGRLAMLRSPAPKEPSLSMDACSAVASSLAPSEPVMDTVDGDWRDHHVEHAVDGGGTYQSRKRRRNEADRPLRASVAQPAEPPRHAANVMPKNATTHSGAVGAAATFCPLYLKFVSLQPKADDVKSSKGGKKTTKTKTNKKSDQNPSSQDDDAKGLELKVIVVPNTHLVSVNAIGIQFSLRGTTKHVPFQLVAGAAGRPSAALLAGGTSAGSEQQKRTTVSTLQPCNTECAVSLYEAGGAGGVSSSICFGFESTAARNKMLSCVSSYVAA